MGTIWLYLEWPLGCIFTAFSKVLYLVLLIHLKVELIETALFNEATVAPCWSRLSTVEFLTQTFERGHLP